MLFGFNFTGMNSMWYLLILCFALNVFGDDRKCRLDRGESIIPDKEMCAYKKFEGPIGSIIAERRCSKIAQAAGEHGRVLVNFVSNSLGFIPTYGCMVRSAFIQISQMYLSSEVTIINRVVRDINKQISALEQYVDCKVQHLEYTQLSQYLVGLLEGARSCADYGDPDQMIDLERCLISFNVRMLGFIGRFQPMNDNIIKYEWSLPLFRQYADLQLTVTEDLFRIALKNNKTSSAKAYLLRLENQSAMFYNYSVSSVDKVIKKHITFKPKVCGQGLKYWNSWNPFSTMRGYFGQCEQTFFRGRKCVEEIIIPLSETKNGVDGRNKARIKVTSCMDHYANDNLRKLENDLRAYWQLELIDVADQWLLLSKKAHEMYLSLRLSK